MKGNLYNPVKLTGLYKQYTSKVDARSFFIYGNLHAPNQ